MITSTSDKIKNISESFLAADHIEKELEERIIIPFYKLKNFENNNFDDLNIKVKKIELNDITEEMINKHLDVQLDDIVNMEQYNLLTNEE